MGLSRQSAVDSIHRQKHQNERYKEIQSPVGKHNQVYIMSLVRHWLLSHVAGVQPVAFVPRPPPWLEAAETEHSVEKTNRVSRRILGHTSEKLSQRVFLAELSHPRLETPFRQRLLRPDLWRWVWEPGQAVQHSGLARPPVVADAAIGMGLAVALGLGLGLGSSSNAEPS